MEETTSHQTYQQGFNDGYMIAKHLPELAEQLDKATGHDERITGMRDGRKQFLAEQLKERLPSWLKQDRFNEPNRTQDQDKGKDIEPDRE